MLCTGLIMDSNYPFSLTSSQRIRHIGACCMLVLYILSLLLASYHNKHCRSTLIYPKVVMCFWRFLVLKCNLVLTEIPALDFHMWHVNVMVDQFGTAQTKGWWALVNVHKSSWIFLILKWHTKMSTKIHENSLFVSSIDINQLSWIFMNIFTWVATILPKIWNWLWT